MSTCRGGCGFFGSEAYQGYCSHCFKQLPKDQANQANFNDDFNKWKKDHEEQVKKAEEENLKKRKADLEWEEGLFSSGKKKKPPVIEKKWPPLTSEARSILETEFIFSNVSQYMTPACVSNFMRTCKSFQKIGSDEAVWRNLYKSKYGNSALVTLVGDRSARSVWKDQVDEIGKLKKLSEISMTDFEKKPYLLQLRLFEKVSVLAPLDQVKSPWSHLEGKDNVSKIIETIWNPVASHMPDLIELLQEKVKKLYVVREKSEDENWYLLYIFDNESEVRFFSGEPPRNNTSEEVQVEGWGTIPTSLAQFYSVHNGFTTFGTRLDSWESGVFRSGFLTLMDSGEEEQGLQVLQFNNDGAGNGQSFIRESNTEKDPLTGDFDHENPSDLNADTPFWEFVEEFIIKVIEEED